jgi:hypothetical protein
MFKVETSVTADGSINSKYENPNFDKWLAFIFITHKKLYEIK